MTKSDLKYIGELSRAIDVKLAICYQLKSDLLPGAVNYTDGGSRCAPSDKMAEAYAKIDQLQREVDKMIDRLCDMKEKAEAVIDKLEDERARTIMTHRYIDLRSWEAIEEATGISRRTMYRLHAEALKELQHLVE